MTIFCIFFDHLDLPSHTERTHVLTFSEGLSSLGDINVFQSFGPHLALLVTTYILCEVKLSNLQRSSEELPLDGRQIHENTLIKIIAPSLMQILGH